jgi:SAM-dependent methyltransferase
MENPSARNGVVIERVRHGAVGDGGTDTWREYKKLVVTGTLAEAGKHSQRHDEGTKVDAGFLDEVHHRQYGRPWALGRFIFEHVVAEGLRPEHRLLDIGCGALRFGHWVIPYLDVGRYHGIDAHLKSLEAAARYEIPLHRLEEKRPRLLWSDRFDVEHFGVTFDWALDFFTTVHVPVARHADVWQRVAAVLAPGAVLLVSPEPLLGRNALESWGLELIGEATQRCELLEGHGFDPTNTWFRYEKSRGPDDRRA